MNDNKRLIYRLILVALLLVMFVFLILMELEKQQESDKQTNEYVDFEILYDDTFDGLKVMYDKNTGVMYAVMYSGKRLGITPIYNADGSVKIYGEPSEKTE